MGVNAIKAKIDTGARTSSLHAYDVTEFERSGEPWVRFSIAPWQATTADMVETEAPIRDRRLVRSSSGHAEERIVILTTIRLGKRKVTSEITLTDRDDMGFRMLIGRETLRHGFLVDAGASYCGGRPRVAVRRKNRGR